jgi:glycosyltransferase involved in cell wall biosynthesis
LATGIQRVARESARRWSRDHDPVFVQWGGRGTSMHRLTTAEVAAALSGEGMSDDADPADPTVLIPWNCRYLLPEVAVERNRVRALTAMLRFSGTTGGSIGFDCVPMTSNETVNIEVGGFFAYGMSVTRHLDRVATISEGAGVEYAGWRTILSGTGVEGPEIRAVPLAVEARKATPEARAQVAEELGLPSIPMVLVVGSHEPRKNHLAVLHAAELLWRKGYRFHVVFVGGQSWRSDEVRGRVAELRAGGRLVDSVTALPDDQLWAAYEMADVVLFPSLNEGFGLPVAEALATGTPVITSRFGPMAEIAAHGGALFVDPRDDHDLAEALARFLDDPDLRARLRAEAERSPTRTWDDYAAEVWAYLAADAAR